MRFLTSYILILASLTGFTAACAAEDHYELVPGIYRGEVFNGDDMDPVVTTFTIDDLGRLGGSYSVDEENGAYSGVLTNVVFDDAYTISMEWTDKFGEGFAVMEFARDFSSFTGEWNEKDSARPLPWSGSK